MNNIQTIKNELNEDFIISESMSLLQINNNLNTNIIDQGLFLKTLTIGENCECTFLVFDKLINEETKQSLQINLNNNSRIYMKVFYSNHFNLDSKIKINVLGRNTEVFIDIIYLAQNNVKYNLDFCSQYIDSSSSGKINIKGILNNSARAEAIGEINIDSKASDINIELNEHAILLSKDAKVKQSPILKVSNMNVKARHAASVTNIDSDTLFYLESRGIEKDVAKKLIVESYFSELLSQLSCKPNYVNYINDKINSI